MEKCTPKDTRTTTTKGGRRTKEKVANAEQREAKMSDLPMTKCAQPRSTKNNDPTVRGTFPCITLRVHPKRTKVEWPNCMIDTQHEVQETCEKRVIRIGTSGFMEFK